MHVITLVQLWFNDINYLHSDATRYITHYTQFVEVYLNA